MFFLSASRRTTASGSLCSLLGAAVAKRYGAHIHTHRVKRGRVCVCVCVRAAATSRLVCFYIECARCRRLILMDKMDVAELFDCSRDRVAGV